MLKKETLNTRFLNKQKKQPIKNINKWKAITSYMPSLLPAILCQ